MFAVWAERSGQPLDDIRARWRVDDAYRQHERGQIDARAFYAHLRQTLGIDLDDDAFETGWNAIFGGEVPGIDERIRRACRLAPCHVFSNTNAAHQAFWAPAHAATLSLFDTVFVSNEIGLRKPDREAFETVCARIRTAPEDTLFFDDSEENIMGARASGLQAVLVASNADIDRALDAVQALA